MNETLLKIDKNIPVPSNRVYGNQLEATLKALKPSESIEIPKMRVYTLKHRLTRFKPGTFTTRSNANGSKRVWKI